MQRVPAQHNRSASQRPFACTQVGPHTAPLQMRAPQHGVPFAQETPSVPQPV